VVTDQYRDLTNRLELTEWNPVVWIGRLFTLDTIPTLVPLEASVVADIAPPVRSDGRPIWATAKLCDHCDFTICINSAQPIHRAKFRQLMR
jgi:hypothetical protein